MPVRDILRLCVLLHISSRFHKFAECALVIKPQDVVAVTGEVATFNCSSNASKCGNIAWSVRESSNYIYALNETSSSVKSYISVFDRDDGNCSLAITASLAAANIYFCRELHSGNEASAELTVMENHGNCIRKIKDLSLHISCSIVSAGKWAPTVICEQVIDGNKRSVLQENEPPTLDNSSNVVTSTWNFISKKDSCNTSITCLTKFKHHGRSTQTIATYCTPCNFAKPKIPSIGGFLNIDESEQWSDPNYNGCFNQAFRDFVQRFFTDLFLFSSICYIVSVSALLLTVHAYAITWKQNGSAQTVFLINLCVALLFGYIFYVTGIHFAIDLKDGCKDIVLLLQYSILGAFSILLAEGGRLLIYIISGFKNKRRRKETILLLAAAWGLPIIIVIVSSASIKVEDYNIGSACWVFLGRSFMWAFIGPILFFVLANIVISIIVLKCLSRNISNLPRSAKARNQIRATLWNMLVTCPVLFLGCLCIAIFIVNGSVFFMQLAILINSLQGILIFIFHVLCNLKKVNDMIPCIYLTFNSMPGRNVDDQTMVAQKPAKKLSLVAYFFGPMTGVELHDNPVSKETQPTSDEASDKL